MKRSHLAGVLGLSAVTMCATAALAEDAYRFTVPYNVSLPASYAGPMTLSVSCAAGGSSMSFDPTSGTVSDGVLRPVTVVTDIALGGSASGAASMADLKGQSPSMKTSTASSQSAAMSSQLQAMQGLGEAQSSSGSGLKTSQMQQAQTETLASQLGQVSQNKGTARQFSGTATVTLAAHPGGINPTTYLCWGVLGKNNAYTTAPFVKGQLPVVAR